MASWRDERDPIKLIELFGGELIRQNGHSIYRLGTRQVVIGKQSNDWRAQKNAIAQIRRMAREQGLIPLSRIKHHAGDRPQDVEALQPIAGPDPLFFAAPPAPVLESPPPVEPAPPVVTVTSHTRRPQAKPVYAPCPLGCPDGKLVGRHIAMHRAKGELLGNNSMRKLSVTKRRRIREERLRAQAGPAPAGAIEAPPPPVPVVTPATQVVTMPLTAGPDTRTLKSLVEALPPLPYDLARQLVPILTLIVTMEGEHTILVREHAELRQRFETLRSTFNSIEHAERLQKIRS